MNHLILIFTVILCMTSCKPEEMPPKEESWVGKWYVKQVLLDGTLQKPINTSSLSQLDFIEIDIPEGDSGRISGYTFRNGFGFDFELSANNMVNFGPVGGTRAGEDEYGVAFKEQIDQTNSFRLKNDTMYFNDINNDILILFTKP